MRTAVRLCGISPAWAVFGSYRNAVRPNPVNPALIHPVFYIFINIPRRWRTKLPLCALSSGFPAPPVKNSYEWCTISAIDNVYSIIGTPPA